MWAYNNLFMASCCIDKSIENNIESDVPIIIWFYSLHICSCVSWLTFWRWFHWICILFQTLLMLRNWLGSLFVTLCWYFLTCVLATRHYHNIICIILLCYFSLLHLTNSSGLLWCWVFNTFYQSFAQNWVVSILRCFRLAVCLQRNTFILLQRSIISWNACFLIWIWNQNWAFP